jgi:hypothetical protein
MAVVGCVKFLWKINQFVSGMILLQMSVHGELMAPAM